MGNVLTRLQEKTNREFCPAPIWNPGRHRCYWSAVISELGRENQHCKRQLTAELESWVLDLKCLCVFSPINLGVLGSLLRTSLAPQNAASTDRIGNVWKQETSLGTREDDRNLSSCDGWQHITLNGETKWLVSDHPGRWYSAAKTENDTKALWNAWWCRQGYKPANHLRRSLGKRENKTLQTIPKWLKTLIIINMHAVIP